ncbi:hypothetical protein RCIP0075_00016 [Klebsiella phage RCIP0075]
MPAGLQTFNPDGSLEIDYTTRLGIFLGEIVTDSTHGGSVYVGPTIPGEFFYYVVPPPAGPGRTPSCQLQNERIYWFTDQDGNGNPVFSLIPCRVFWGVQ